MRCPEAKELFSDYLEEYLIEPERSRLMEHLAGCVECREELDDLQRALGVIHDLPPQEPVLDMWADLLPACAQIRAESRLSLIDRMRRSILHFRERVQKGWVVFTAVARYNAYHTLRGTFTGH